MAGTASGGSRRSRLAPYLLVAPGMLWLLVFFVSPIITLAQTSVSGPTGAWWSATSARWPTTASTSSARSATRSRPPCWRWRWAIRWPTSSPSAAGRLKNLLLGLVVLPFFTTFLVRTFAWKTILNDGGPAVVAAAAPPPAGPGRPPARHHDRGGRRPDLQFPAVHDPADLREPGEDRPAAGRGGRGPVLARPSGRSARWCCRSRSRRVRREPAHLHSGGRRLHQRRAAWGAPTSR